MGEAVAKKIAAETGAFMKLYANQVFIGSGGNLIPDPGFLDAELNTARTKRSTGTWTLVPGTATEPAAMQHVMASTNDTFQYWGNTPTAARTGELIKVAPGQVFSLAVDVTTSAMASVRWNAYLLKADGSVTYTGLTTRSGTGRRALTQEYTIPAGVVGIAFAVACLTNGVTFTVHGNARVSEKITPSLIVDGFFQGLRVIGASVESNAAAGRGVKFNDNGLVAYDSTGRETVRLDGANSILTGATVRTAAAGARWQMSTAGLEAWDAAGKRYLLGDANGLQLTGTVTTEASVETSAGVFTKTLASLTAGALNRAGVLAEAPGVWGTRDGRSLGGFGFLTSGNFEGVVVSARDVQIEGHETATLDAGNVVVGYNEPGARHNVDLRGNVSHNGVPLRRTEVFRFSCTGTKTPANAGDQLIARFAPVAPPGETYKYLPTNPQSNGAGTIQVMEEGIYNFSYQMLLGRAVEARSFIDIADSTGATMARTGISIGEDQGTAVAGGVQLKAGDTVRFLVYQQTGMTIQYTARVNVIRLP